ncbi:MAG TPA: Rieske 2Fe-2S domain-containing protein [Candidatus Binataceae bacterium]|nr:Rieske 2Fe-2S domain-containing protein [Candidatus Binataceae bacterium]
MSESATAPPSARPTPGPQSTSPGGESTTRRGFLLRVGLALNALAIAALAIPVVGYIASPMRKFVWLSWISLGPLDTFPEHQTRLATYRNPYTKPWDGATANIPCWVRRESGETFQVFAINCTHLGCPVRWFQESGLFMCPCHGGVYYSDGQRASGPPPRGLYQYRHKVEKGQLWVSAGELPTLGEPLA